MRGKEVFQEEYLKAIEVVAKNYFDQKLFEEEEKTYKKLISITKDKYNKSSYAIYISTFKYILYLSRNKRYKEELLLALDLTRYLEKNFSNDLYTLSQSYEAIAYSLETLNKFSFSENFYRKSIELAKKSTKENPDFLVNTLYSFSELLFFRKKYQQSLWHIEHCLSLLSGEKSGDLPRENESLFKQALQLALDNMPKLGKSQGRC